MTKQRDQMQIRERLLNLKGQWIQVRRTNNRDLIGLLEEIRSDAFYLNTGREPPIWVKMGHIKQSKDIFPLTVTVKVHSQASNWLVTLLLKLIHYLSLEYTELPVQNAHVLRSIDTVKLSQLRSKTK